MNYPISFYLKISSILIQSSLLFCGFYFQIQLCFTLSYFLTITYLIAAVVLPNYFQVKHHPNELKLKRQAHFSIVSMKLVAGIALCFFTVLGKLFFDTTYYIETITLFFAAVLLVEAFERPPATVLRWEKEGLLIMGEKISNTLAQETISDIALDEDSILIYTHDGITHHIENIIWDQETQEITSDFFNSVRKRK